MLRSALAVILCSLSFSAVADGLYGFVDDAGVAHFSDAASDQRYRRLSLSGSPALAAPSRRAAPATIAPATIAPAALRDRVVRIAAEHGIAPALALALVEVESGFRVDARSPKGALGLMQLMPATAAHYGVGNPLDADANLRGGMRYLCDLFALFGRTELALAAYNAGEGAVARYGNTVPPYPETVAYVPRILARRAELARDPAIGLSDYQGRHSTCIR
ncbi:lytic transglycosylase domain-containing protein [Azoarcus olearius]|uniref:lytic transglycosylase domain-containing protein n=1 Tax=Azoarcus sp. (strain BH72) TaxID=418699 RepID=UPI000323F1D6|nr:lytic transglycosylase domain-containing protein [Azoarcus olearius]